MSLQVTDTAQELLDYTLELAKLTQKPYFKLSEYEKYWLEETFLGKSGIVNELTEDAEGQIWLKIPRLKRILPPEIPEIIEEWVTVKNDPKSPPIVAESITKSISIEDAQKLINEGVVNESAIQEPITLEEKSKKRDVIFYLKDDDEINNEINYYIDNAWKTWSKSEIPRRETIEIYDQLFGWQQTLELQSEELPIEFVIGIGTVKWNYEGKHKIEHPIIEQKVELEVNREDGSLLIRPRDIRPHISLEPYTVLEIEGTELLRKFSKDHVKNLIEINKEITLHDLSSYEPILRTAALRLSNDGVYWPDANPNSNDRTSPKISDKLIVTDNWSLFLRKNRPASFSDDIKRFRDQLETSIENKEESKTEKTSLSNNVGLKRSSPTVQIVSKPSNEAKIPKMTAPWSRTSPGDERTSSTSTDTELLFPKEFNEDQIRIIQELQKYDGVVVQGPPGTGKTHTIANIICHYLASGKNVLVTSHGVPALDVLREQIPDELRDLTISLLTNERSGFKQLEVAVSMLSNIVTQTNVPKLKKDTDYLKKKISKLKSDIGSIENQILDIGDKQFSKIRDDLGVQDQDIDAMQLAEIVKQDINKYEWLDDVIDYKSKPRFTDKEINNAKKIRLLLKNDLLYIDKKIPQINQLPIPSKLASIHSDLIRSIKLKKEIEDNSLPFITKVSDERISFAESILGDLQKYKELLLAHRKNPWIESTTENIDSDKKVILDQIYNDLADIVKTRLKYLKQPVFIPNLTDYKSEYLSAIENLIDNKKPVSVFNLKSKKIKNLLTNTTVKGQSPASSDEWRHVHDYLDFQKELEQFISVWNNASIEFGLPKFNYVFNEYPTKLDSINKLIVDSKEIKTKNWPKIEENLPELIDLSESLSTIYNDISLVDKYIEALKVNIAYFKLSKRRDYIIKTYNSVRNTTGPISETILSILKDDIGNVNIESNIIINRWEDALAELARISKYEKYFQYLKFIANKIHKSGAPIWSNKLLSQPSNGKVDSILRDDWSVAWLWKRRFNYIDQIESGDLLKKLNKDRDELEQNLKQSVRERIKLLTHISLHQTMTDHVKSALYRVMSALAKVGKGTGKGAPAHRKDASNAMKECYEGVPCWIMPSWRISETLPSTFGSFDLVIIDEASQSDVSILPAILRAKKLLVVGDDKQVSPEAAFIKDEKIQQLRSFVRNQPFGPLLLPGNSIYELAKSAFPSQLIMLKEHFRCVEAIITFSKRFYTEELIPLRYPKKSERIDPPLVDIYVPGGERDNLKNTNELEADAIVEEIKKLTEKEKLQGRTIGIISLTGKEQAHFIQEKLLSEIGEETYLKYSMACGDSATFQGKEKDIVFLSMVVDPNKFSALTKRSYQQRFNVALSRARDRMYLVRSITENDLRNQEDLRLQTILYFKDPMPTHKFHGKDDAIKLCQSEFERSFYKRLIALEYQVIPQVKVGPYSIDLVVEGENDNRLAIELDGDKYHTADKWADDFKRQRTMERMGWTFWRCWGSSYMLDPDKCITNLIEKLDEMEIKPIKSGTYVASKYSEYREYSPTLDVNSSDLFSENHNLGQTYTSA